MLSISVLLFIISLCLFRLWHKKFYSYWKIRGFPSDAPNFPMGSFKNMGYKLHSAEKFDEIYQEFSVRKGQKMAGLFFVFSHGLAVYDPELIRKIIVKDFNSFHDHYL